MNGFSFCESVHATGTSSWHIRKLDVAGKKLGGGITTASLCGKVKNGWDLDVPMTLHHLSHCCHWCRDAMLQEISK